MGQLPREEGMQIDVTIPPLLIEVHLCRMRMVSTAANRGKPMATRFNYTLSITVSDEQLDDFRAEAIRRYEIRKEADKRAFEDGTLSVVPGTEWEESTLDPNDLEDCARTLLGCAVDEILDTIHFDRSSHGLVDIEFGVDPDKVSRGL